MHNKKRFKKENKNSTSRNYRFNSQKFKLT